eukprot:7259138-Prymnesium_polylepis.1
MCVSYADPEARVPLLLEGLSECQGVRAHRVPIVTRNGFNGRRFHYLYACRLGAPLPPDSVAGMTTDDEDARAEALLRACVAHDEERVAELLRGGACATSTSGNLELTTPCMLAAGVGALGCLLALVDAAGVEHVLESADVLGQTALHHAAMGGQPETLAALLELYPTAELPRNAEGGSAVQMAAAAGSEACVLLLLQREQQEQRDELPPAVGGHPSTSRARTPSVASADRTGFTPLHAAAYRGHAAVCVLLLQRGASAGAVCCQSAHDDAVEQQSEQGGDRGEGGR